MDKKIKVKHEGELAVGDISIPCFVLEDGTRVLSGRGFQEAIKVRDRIEGEKRGGYILPTFLDSKSLNPFIVSKIGVAKLEPIIAYRGNQKIHGYEATILADVCDAILEARRAGIKLTDRQALVADQCEILMRAFAKVGIIALVDEATGYQFDREAQELQEILKKYISEELLIWSKRFPDIFYKEIFRLNGWNYTVKGINKRPGVIGTWTNQLIYNQLPKGVLAKLKTKTPKDDKGNRKHRFHQLLSIDIGQPDLQRQLTSVITIMKLSKDWDHFKHQFDQLYGQASLFDHEEGHVDPLEGDDISRPAEPPSDFNKKLGQALNFNPKKDKKK